MLTRREALGIMAGATLVSGCARLADGVRRTGRVPAPVPEPHDDLGVAVLDRFGFGPNTSDLEKIRAVGTEAWFESQLEPGEDEPADLQIMLGRLDINYLGPYDLRSWREEAIVAQMQQQAVLRAVYSPWQVRERICDFWTNHFNIYAKKGLAAYRKPIDERTVVRENALGSFPRMLTASSQSTAMLVYLDQQDSTAAHPNENYARELMELHTLGVTGGYTQKDVMEVARCFTGWAEERRFLRKKGAFRFVPEWHDDGQKTVLGKTIPAGQGVEDGEAVVGMLARHPSTAKYIATKLARSFVGVTDAGVVGRIAGRFTDSNGDIRETMRQVFQEFLDHRKPVAKRPFDYVVSGMRALDASTDAAGPVLESLDRMGQALYLWPMPDGYPVDVDAWTGSLLARWNFALKLAKNGMKGTNVDLSLLTSGSGGAESVVFRRVLPAGRAGEIRSATKGLDQGTQIAVCMGSPEFQWR